MSVWTERIIFLRNRSWEVSKRHEDAIITSAYDKWKKGFKRHSDDLRLMQSYQYVKREGMAIIESSVCLAINKTSQRFFGACSQNGLPLPKSTAIDESLYMSERMNSNCTFWRKLGTYGGSISKRRGCGHWYEHNFKNVAASNSTQGDQVCLGATESPCVRSVSHLALKDKSRFDILVLG